MEEDQYSPKRGVFLLAKLEEIETALLVLPESERRNFELYNNERLRKGVVSRLCSTPRGVTYYAFSEMAIGQKITFPDVRKLQEFNAVSYLMARFGKPDSLISPLNDEAAVELVEAALGDPHAWLYVKRVCATELISGREMPEILRFFAGIALFRPEYVATRGRKKVSNQMRDAMISKTGLLLKDRFCLPLSRGFGSTSDSVCSIIAETLSAFGYYLSEDAVRKIIEKAGPDDQFPQVAGKY